MRFALPQPSLDLPMLRARVCAVLLISGLVGFPPPPAAAQQSGTVDTGTVKMAPPQLPWDTVNASTNAARGPDWTVASLEIGSVMALGLGIYIYKGERNAYDWPLTWARLEERFTTLNHFRFDDNEFAMNNVAHPVAGALYYRFGRSNGFGPLGSTLWSVAGSTFWEVVVELREIASLNDLIATPATGVALGEALHQHTEFFRRGSRGFRNSFLDKAFSGPVLINRLFGERTPPRASSLTSYGLPADRAHQIRLYLGPMIHLGGVPLEAFPEPGETLSGAVDDWMITVGATSEISSIEPPDQGGVHETAGLPLTRLELHVNLAESAPTEMDLRAETVFDGWRGSSLSRDAKDRVRGARWFVGPATAFTVRLDHRPGARWMELFANAHLLGMRADGVVRDGPWRVRWTGTVYGDFSSVRPLALDEFVLNASGLPEENSVLWRNQYYYGYGATLRSRLELDVGPVGFRGEVDHHTFDPFSGPHRTDEMLGQDAFPLRDRRTYGRAWLEYSLRGALQLAAGVEGWSGWGRMGEHVVEGGESRFMLRLTAAP